MKREFTGSHMLFAMIAFFGVIIAVNVFMATVANLSWTGLVVENSYVESQRFNERIAATQARDAKGWRAQLMLRQGRPVYRLTDAAGAAVQVKKVIATISRPTHENDDGQQELHRDERGEFIGKRLPGGGVWTIEIDALLADGTHDTRLFRIEAGDG